MDEKSGFTPLSKPSKSAFTPLDRPRFPEQKNLIGNNRHFQKRSSTVAFTRKDRQNHTHVIGSTGTGKSKFMELLMRQDMRDRKAGFCLLDPHGSLYEEILLYASHNGKHLADRFVLFNPAEEREHVLGFNPIPDNATENIDYVLDMLISGCLKAWGQDNTDKTPRITKWLENIFYTIIANNLTLVETAPLLSVSPRYKEKREVLLRRVGSDVVLDDWAMFHHSTNTQKQMLIEGASNRLRKFLRNEAIRNVIGQKTKTLDLHAIMNEGKILLVNLNGKQCISYENTKLLGIMIVNEFFRVAKLRDPRDSKLRPFYLYIDEFANFITRDIARALEECRKFKLFLILAHQHLAQLKEDDEYLYASVLTNCKNKVVFGGLSKDDVQIMSNEITTGFVDLKSIKDEVYSTKVRHLEETRIVRSRSKGVSTGTNESTSTGASESRGRTEGTAHTEGSSETKTKGGATTTGSSETRGESETTGSTKGYNDSSGGTSGETWGTSETETTGTSYMRGRARSEGASGSKTHGYADSTSSSETTGTSHMRGGARTKGTSGSKTHGYADSTGSSETSGTSHMQGGAHSEGMSGSETHGYSDGTSSSDTQSNSRSHTSSIGTTSAHGYVGNTGKTRNPHTGGYNTSEGSGYHYSNGQTQNTGTIDTQNRSHTNGTSHTDHRSQTKGWSSSDTKNWNTSQNQSHARNTGHTESSSASHEWNESDTENWSDAKSRNRTKGSSHTDNYNETQGWNRSEAKSWSDTESRSTSTGRTHSENKSTSRSHTDNFSESQSQSTSHSRSTSHSDTENWSAAEGTNRSDTRSESRSESQSRSETQSRGSSHTESTGESESVVPFLNPQEYTELTSRTFWTKDELHYMELAKMKNQGTGQAFIKIGEKAPIETNIEHVKPVPYNPRFSPKRIDAFRDAVFEKNGQFYTPMLEARQEYEQRQRIVFGEPLRFDEKPLLYGGDVVEVREEGEELFNE